MVEQQPTRGATIPVTMYVDGIEYAPGVEEQASRYTAERTAHAADDVRNTGYSKINRILGALNQDISAGDWSGENGQQLRQRTQLIKFVGDQFDKLSQTLVKGTTMAFDVVEDIYKEMKKNSPLLQTLESLFNLAMQLFFMPLGNKLAEVLLPAVINLVETAAKMWDELGDGNLASIFAFAIEYGVRALGEFFKSTGSLLKDQGGILSSIGNVLEAVGNFIENNLLGVINLILNAVKFVIDNLKSIIVAIVTFKAASLAMDLITTTAIITSNQAVFGTSVGVGALGVLAAGVGTAAALGSMGFADGGVVPHTPGGKLVTVAENEDEIIMPRSKAVMGGNITNNYYGYTSDDIREMIDRQVSEKVSLSYIRGGL